MGSHRNRLSVLALIAGLAGCAVVAPPVEESVGLPPIIASDGTASTLLERASQLELDTEYVAPPGVALHHHTAGFAKTLCSGVFVTGLDEAFAAESIGYFTSPIDERDAVVARVVDRDAKMVHLTLGDGVVRSAKYLGDLGCVALPIGESAPFYEPIDIQSNLQETDAMPWPIGQAVSDVPLPAGVDAAKLTEALDTAFSAGAMTAAFVVTYRGEIIAERYGEGIDRDTALESWSMGKSLSATLLGVLMQQGVYQLDQAAPIPEWQTDGDARAEITIRNILNMSSGLRCRAPQDPDFDAAAGYPDHLYLYTGTINSFQWAATRPQQWPPNRVGRYRNCDPVLTNYLIRLAVEGRGETYHQFPQSALFDKLGIRTMVMETDPYGNFLTQGYELASARDWARLGNLYLNGGVWAGERILPQNFVDFVSTLAPAWDADARPIYGGFFWLAGPPVMSMTGGFGMAGAGGQHTVIVPSRELVVVRLGHYRGAPVWSQLAPRVSELLLEALPAG